MTTRKRKIWKLVNLLQNHNFTYNRKLMENSSLSSKRRRKAEPIRRSWNGNLTKFLPTPKAQTTKTSRTRMERDGNGKFITGPQLKIENNQTRRWKKKRFYHKKDCEKMSRNYLLWNWLVYTNLFFNWPCFLFF